MKIIPAYKTHAFNDAIAQYRCEDGEVISFNSGSNKLYVTFFHETNNNELMFTNSTSFDVNAISIESFIRKNRPYAIKIK